MAVNDVIRSGAIPIAISDNIHAQASNPELVKQWLKGIAKGAIEAECPVTSGEIGDVAEIIKGIAEGAGFDMVVATIGQVAKEKIITGKNIKTEEGKVKAVVHITGDAYLKFNNLTSFSPNIGFQFTNFKPQPIFRVIQETAKQLGLAISDEEMFRTFNMGWGFA